LLISRTFCEQVSDRPQSAVKKSIRFEDLPEKMVVAEPEVPVTPDTQDTDDIIKAANDLVEKMKNKSKTLGNVNKEKSKKSPVSSINMTSMYQFYQVELLTGLI